MYMVLAWTVAAGQDSAQVTADIQNAIAAREFMNPFGVFENHIIANVDRNYTATDELAALAQSLNDTAAGRFTFAMYLVPKGNFPWFSTDLDPESDTFDAIASY
ncbi:MAG: hypothetical protein WD825_11580 [Gemmatimonadaceae bacterium]